MAAIIAVCIALAVLHVGLNIFITRRVLAHEDYDAFQRRAQILIIWLMPIAGLVVVWWFSRPRLQRKRTGPEEADDDVQESVLAGE